MSAKKSDASVADAPAICPGGLWGLVRGNARWIVFIGVFVAVCAVGWKMLWEAVREQVINAADYRIDPEQIEMTPLPAWIHSDLKAEVLRDASLDGPLSLLDPELTGARGPRVCAASLGGQGRTREQAIAGRRDGRTDLPPAGGHGRGSWAGIVAGRWRRGGAANRRLFSDRRPALSANRRDRHLADRAGRNAAGATRTSPAGLKLPPHWSTIGRR